MDPKNMPTVSPDGARAGGALVVGILLVRAGALRMASSRGISLAACTSVLLLLLRGADHGAAEGHGRHALFHQDRRQGDEGGALEEAGAPEGAYCCCFEDGHFCYLSAMLSRHPL